MELDYQTLLNSSLRPDLPEHRVVKLLKEISENFTTSREKIDLYTKSDNFVTAYSLFYLPTNAPKLTFVLDSLPKSIQEELGGTSFIDMGCGPGTYSLSWLDFFKETFNSNIHLVDSSQVMLDQAKKYLKSFFPKEKHLFFHQQLPTNIHGPRTLFFGNSFNEIGARGCFDMVKRLKPDYLFFIEPGTPAVFKEMMEFRKKIFESGYGNIYPCPSLKPSCPIVQKIKDGEEDWCHQVLKMTHDQSIERLSQLISKDRRVMPMLAHVYKLNPDPTPARGARYVRFLSESKHAFNWQVCLHNEGERLVQFEIPKKTIGKKEVKKFRQLSVGLEVQYEVLKKIRDDLYRIKLTKSLI